MNTLHSLQQQFTNAILENNDQDARPGSGETKAPKSIEQAIASKAISSKRRLNVYRNNVNISLRDSLKAIYPVIHRLVGNDFFRVMAQQYIREYPSVSGNLHDFGNQFPDFIANYPPVRDLVYLPDVARLEWAYHAVFHAADVAAFDIGKLQEIEPRDYGRLVFMLNPASALIHSSYPVLQIWQANQINEYASAQYQENISLDEGETLLLVLRKELDIEFHPVSPAEFNFLTEIAAGKNFFNACDAASDAQTDCNVGELLQKLILTQAIVDFKIED